jgi:hypothetical protein
MWLVSGALCMRGHVLRGSSGTTISRSVTGLLLLRVPSQVRSLRRARSDFSKSDSQHCYFIWFYISFVFITFTFLINCTAIFVCVLLYFWSMNDICIPVLVHCTGKYWMKIYSHLFSPWQPLGASVCFKIFYYTHFNNCMQMNSMDGLNLSKLLYHWVVFFLILWFSIFNFIILPVGLVGGLADKKILKKSFLDRHQVVKLVKGWGLHVNCRVEVPMSTIWKYFFSCTCVKINVN